MSATGQQTAARVTGQTFLGLFLVAMATLMYEMLLTRIFSVTMWYHFAFMAVSIAMFGMSAGAVAVYLRPKLFAIERAHQHLVVSTLFFAVSIVVVFLIQVWLPPLDDSTRAGLAGLALVYTLNSVPFFFAGINVCLALTKFRERVSQLYAADLAGAATGCLLLIPLLNIADGPSAIFVVASFASLAAFFYTGAADLVPRRRLAAGLAALLFAFGALNTVVAAAGNPLVHLTWVKGRPDLKPIYEKWNSFSRVQVLGHPFIPHRPFSWGLSVIWPDTSPVLEIGAQIDATAATVMTFFDGNLARVRHLKYDVTNLAHYIRPDSRVLVIGVGGGRDILSALTFGQKSVVGVEMNDNILHILNGVFGDYTGHLDRNPKVSFVNDEARSYVARSKDRFDIIQISMVDTFAATAAGAFALTENGLYTLEAWKILLDHLSPQGVLTVSRWFFQDRPAEIYRLTALACASLKQLGVKNPRDHIVIVANLYPSVGGVIADGLGTVLVGRRPFSERELDIIQAFARQNRFEVILSSRTALNSRFAAIASGENLDRVVAQFPLNIAPPTDDSPYFFHMLRLKDVLRGELQKQGEMSCNTKAVSVLAVLLVTVLVLTSLCIFLPLVLTADKVPLSDAWPLLVYFAAIGLGFMFVEISQMQRLIIFLGHPVYGLSVVLFTLLLAGGLGSLSTAGIDQESVCQAATGRLTMLLAVLVVFGAITPFLISYSQGATTALRVVLALVLLFPLGALMGMAFPLGMTMVGSQAAALTPWLWGVNGATSVCASVLAIAIAISFGISAAFWTGAACYVLAFLIPYWLMSKQANVR